MWNRKTRFERKLDAIEADTATAVHDLATTLRDRVGGEQGAQIADALNNLAQRVENLELGDQLMRSRKEIERATKKARKQIKRSGEQVAALSAQAVPAEPQGWIGPTVFGFLLGFGAGFLVARTTARKPEQH